MVAWWCYRCGVARAMAVCPTCGLEAPGDHRAADQQKVSTPEALHAGPVLKRATSVRSFVSQLRSKLFRPRRNSADVSGWWCYRCGVTLVSFVCPTCGLRGPEYRDPARTVDDLERSRSAQEPLMWTVSNAKVASTRANQVGYLTRNNDYPRGEVSEAVIDCLVRLAMRPLGRWLGYHCCDLDPCGMKQPCPELRYKGVRIPSRCCTDILVPDQTAAYVAPALILHYILFHQYAPPTCFLEAVLACPDPSSSEYLDAIERVYPAASAF